MCQPVLLLSHSTYNAWQFPISGSFMSCRSQIALVWLASNCVDISMQNLRQEGSGAMLPQENFLEIWCSELDGLWDSFFGPKMSLQVLFQSWHCNRIFICFMSTRMEIGVHQHWLFHTQGLCEGTAGASRSEFYLHLIWILLNLAKNVWPLRQGSC